MLTRPAPIPGPWQFPPPFRPRYVTPGEDVSWVATCDRCGTPDATWRKGKDAARPTCTCTCQPEEGAA